MQYRATNYKDQGTVCTTSAGRLAADGRDGGLSEGRVKAEYVNTWGRVSDQDALFPSFHFPYIIMVRRIVTPVFSHPHVRLRVGSLAHMDKRADAARRMCRAADAPTPRSQRFGWLV